jgi:hypothetical protein
VWDALRRQDHWAITNTSSELAIRQSFTEEHKLELFIAGEEMIANLASNGKMRIEKSFFTEYRLGFVLLHREKAARGAKIRNPQTLDVKTYDDLVTFIRLAKIRRFYIITDVSPTAESFRIDLLNKLGTSYPVELEVRDYWTREEADYYDDTPKIYVFSAPLLSVLKRFKNKYCVIDVARFAPFKTYVGAKVRPGASDKLVTDITSAITLYYASVFGLAATARQSNALPTWWRGAGRCYSRAADSARQPDPFPSAKYSPQPKSADDLEYLRILRRHL